MANSYLNKTFGTPTNSAIWTFSAWIKRSSLSGSQKFFAAGSSSTDRTEMYFAGNTGEFYIYRNISGSTIELGSTRMFRDTSAWYNFVVQNNNGTVAVYVNGETVSMSNSTSLGTNKINNASTAHYIGRQVADTSQNFDGYMSHVSFVDGSVVAPTVFGETDSTSGIWKFKSPSGVTWGNNGFHLKFENSGALGTDSSGNTNTFTVNGDLKQALDTPSNVYATGNPLNQPHSDYALTQGNNTITLGGGTEKKAGSATMGVASGKWYWEVKFLSQSAESYCTIGISGASDLESGTAGSQSTDYFYRGQNATLKNNGGATSYGATWGAGDIIGVALDCTSAQNTLTFYKNGATQGAINITSVASTPNGVYLPSVGKEASAVPVFNFNFGNGFFGTTAITSAGSNGNGSLFEYDVPSGYYALNTKNINTYG